MEVIITTILISSLVAQMKESACNAGDPGLISEGNGNPFQYSCPENTMDRGAWQDTESDMTEQLSTHIDNTTK